MNWDKTLGALAWIVAIPALVTFFGFHLGSKDQGNFKNIPEIHSDFVVWASEFAPEDTGKYLANYAFHLSKSSWKRKKANKMYALSLRSPKVKSRTVDDLGRWMNAPNLISYTKNRGDRFPFWEKHILSAIQYNNSDYFLALWSDTLENSDHNESGDRFLKFSIILFENKRREICKFDSPISSSAREFISQLSISGKKYTNYYSSKYLKKSKNKFKSYDFIRGLCKGKHNYSIGRDDAVDSVSFYYTKESHIKLFRYYFSPSYRTRIQSNETKKDRNEQRRQERIERKRRLKANGNDGLSKFRAAFGLCRNNNNKKCRRAPSTRRTYTAPAYNQDAYYACKNQIKACLAQCAGLPTRHPGQNGFSYGMYGGPKDACRHGCRKMSC